MHFGGPNSLEMEFFQKNTHLVKLVMLVHRICVVESFVSLYVAKNQNNGMKSSPKLQMKKKSTKQWKHISNN